MSRFQPGPAAPPDGSVTTNKLADGAVTNAKIASVAAAKVTGLAAVATSGAYTDLSGKPTLADLGGAPLGHTHTASTVTDFATAAAAAAPVQSVNGQTGAVVISAGGGFTRQAISANANVTGTGDAYVGVTSIPTNGLTVTLPAASGRAGQQVIVTDETGTAGSGTSLVKIAAAGTDKIQGAPAFIIDDDSGSITLVSDGASGWKVTHAVGAVGADPRSIGTLWGWWDANRGVSPATGDSNTNVTNWSDLSGNGLDLNDPNGGGKRIPGGFNGRMAVFGHMRRFTPTPTLTTSGGFTLCMAVLTPFGITAGKLPWFALRVGSGTDGIWFGMPNTSADWVPSDIVLTANGLNGGQRPKTYTGGPSNTPRNNGPFPFPMVLCGTITANSGSLRWNGKDMTRTTLTNGTIPATVSGNLYLNEDGTGAFANAYIGAALIFAPALSTTEVRAVERYLQAKFRL